MYEMFNVSDYLVRLQIFALDSYKWLFGEYIHDVSASFAAFATLVEHVSHA